MAGGSLATACGIYIIRNKTDGKVYVGQSVQIGRRKGQHFHELRLGRHHCLHLQRAFKKCGEDAFEHVIVQLCEPEELTRSEQRWMDFYRKSGLYNSAPAAGSTLGFKHREETKIKMSASQRAKAPPTSETIARMSATRRGRKQTEAFRQLMLKVHTGRVPAEETRKKISESLKGRPAHNRGKKASEETRAKLRAARLGKALTEETRMKLSQALTGKRKSDEARAAMSEAAKGRISHARGTTRPKEVGERISAAKKGRANGLLGRKLTEEHKQNMRLGQLRARELRMQTARPAN